MNELLLKAAQEGAIKELLSLLEQGADPDAKDSMGNTPLHLAAKNGHFSCVQQLVKRGANPKLKNQNGDTPLHLAASQGHVESVKYLFSYTNLNLGNCHGLTSLELAKMISVHSAHADGYTALHDDTPLHLAGSQRHFENVKYLFSHTNLNLENCHGLTSLELAKMISVHSAHADSYTSLHIAAAKNDTKMIRELIMYGADSSLMDKFKTNALDHAILNGHYKAVCCLLKQGGYINSAGHKNVVNLLRQGKKPSKTKILELLQSCHKLMDIAEKNSKESVENLVKLLADGLLNGRQYERGYTALHWFVENNNIHVVKLLLDNGANPNIQDKEGNTALHVAVMSGHSEMVKELFNRGADCEICTKDGHSVLRLAIAMGNLDIVKLLLKLGINFRLYFPDGGSIESYAAVTPGMIDLFMAVLEFLRWSSCETIEMGVQPALGLSILGDALNAQGIEDKKTIGSGYMKKMCFENGNTALHNLLTGKMYSSRLLAIKILLQAGASMVIKNQKNKTPLDLALQTKNPYLIALFYISEIKQYGLNLEKDPNLPIKVEGIQQKLKELLEIIHKEYPQTEPSKEVKRHKEAKEEISTESLSVDRKNEICFDLGIVLFQYRTKAWQPHLAYECLSVIDRNSDLYPRANELMYEMLIGRRVVIEQEDVVSRDLGIRTAISHLLESNSDHQNILGKLTADYVNHVDTMRGIEGVTGKNEASFMAMLHFLKMTIQKFKESKTERETLTVTHQSDKDRFEKLFKLQQKKLLESEERQLKIRHASRDKQQKLKYEIEQVKAKIRSLG